MHGIEVDAYQDDNHDDSLPIAKENESMCMEYLGLSWRDFI